MNFVAVIAAIALLQYIYFSYQVGQARGKYGVAAPAVTGDPIFERHHRVHQNTLENLVVFLPGLWLFATYVNPLIASVLGLIVIVGRAIYATRYVAEPESRGVGVAIYFPAMLVLVVGGAIGAVIAAF